MNKMTGNTTGLKGLDKLAAHPGVDYIYRDGDGIWVELRYGWRNTYDEPVGCLHGIHEDTVRDVLLRKGHIVPCDCADCIEGAARAAAKVAGGAL
jgi:hypothetical protein